jgi:hypothetical protein
LGSFASPNAERYDPLDHVEETIADQNLIQLATQGHVEEPKA